ncbi:hypothetical protein B0H11DRAFT_2014186 [Mycena galericulata]|nr:hypothetical protein B0H11DRAFT_2014186 [Mycena galericulata]
MFSTRWADEQRLSSSPSDHELSSPTSPLHTFPRIQLSPKSPILNEEDYRLSWDPPQEKVSYPLPSFRSLFSIDDEEHPLTSEYDPSDYSEPGDPAHDDTDSEDEEQDPFFSDTRVTFFHTSAERLRPRHPLLRIAARTTSPAPSPAPSLVQRNISEPAPCTKIAPSDETDDHPAPILTHVSPVLSPISLSVSPMVGPVSPLSALESLSPLSSPLSSLAGEHDMDLESFPDNHEIPPIESETGLGLFDSPPVPPSPPSCPSPHVAFAEPLTSTEVTDAVSTSAPAEDHVVHDSAMDVDPMVPKKKKKAVPKLNDPVPAPNSSTTAVTAATGSRVKKVIKTVEKEDKGKKRQSQQPLSEEGPKSKKARIAHSSPEPSASRQLPQSRTKRVEQKPTRTTLTKEKGKKVTRTDARNSPPPEPKAKPKSRRARPRSSSPSTSSSVSSKRSTQKRVPEIDPELCGMLIECMATSRASSLPYSYPSLKSRGTERECLEVMERVLESGTVAGGGTGVFGKVKSNAKDDSDPPLEAQWFYVPERDQDQDRAQLIRSMMPRPAKRGVTKEPKQYYYRPLEKISRWDPEDEL